MTEVIYLIAMIILALAFGAMILGGLAATYIAHAAQRAKAETEKREREELVSLLRDTRRLSQENDRMMRELNAKEADR